MSTLPRSRRAFARRTCAEKTCVKRGHEGVDASVDDFLRYVLDVYAELDTGADRESG